MIRIVAALSVVNILRPYGGKMGRSARSSGGMYYCPNGECPRYNKKIKLAGGEQYCRDCGMKMKRKRRK